METPIAVTALAALAHEARLGLFRLLLRRGPSGAAAGEIAAAVGITPSSLTFHIGALERAGLVRSWRDGRFVRYAVEVDGVRQLLAFLTEECCDGRPELCGGLATVACGSREGVEE